jgi:hypothetical protein
VTEHKTGTREEWRAIVIRQRLRYGFHVTIDPSVAPVEYSYRNQAQLEQARAGNR